MSTTYDPPNIVFPHIMKVGGTTLNWWIQRHYRSEEILHAASGWKQLLRLPLSEIEGRKFVRGHFGSGILNLFGDHNGFVPIAVLRDPVERVISHFWHIKAAPDAYLGDASDRFAFVREDSFTLEDFVEHPETEFIVSNYQTGNFSAILDAAHAGMLPQRPSVYPMNPAAAHAFIERCAVVGVSEDLDAFVAALSARFGFHPERRLPRARSYTRGAPASQAVRERIRELNGEDLELYSRARSRISTTARSYSLPNPVNPNFPETRRLLEWNAGEPYFGCGWADVIIEGERHVWSIENISDMEFSLSPNATYTVLFTLVRFVSPVQREGFVLLCNGNETELLPAYVDHDAARHVYAAVVAADAHGRLCLGFKVRTLVPFSEVADDTDELPRGIALAKVVFLPTADPDASARKPYG